MRRILPLRRFTFLAAGCLLATAPAFAAIPTGYQGKPFDPAVAGGVGIIPPAVKAGPYAVPGRVAFPNYDMGGDNVGYHTEAHYTTKDGDGYRSDRPSATLSLTGPTKPDVYYDTGTAQDGTAYPNATDRDFYIGSVHPGDWFNYTVDVKTAGTYALSSVFSTGNGPPGGEGGDGQMELVISVNGTKKADWHAVFPDYQNKANFHNWKPYPNFAMLTLEAGLQVIRFDLPFKHLNLDYVQLDLVGADGGTDAGGGGTGGAGAAGGTGGSGAAGATGGSGGTGAAGDGAAGASGSAGTSGGAGAGGGSTGTAGANATGAAGTTGAAGASVTGTAGAKGGAADSGGGCSCAVSSPAGTGFLGAGTMLVLALVTRARRRRR